LVIEIDGDIHLEDAVRLKDIERQAVIEQYKLHFLRFEDVLIKRDIDGVLNDIKKWILDNNGAYTRVPK
jgi:very-short-patch-repair endonuclease